MHSMKDAFSEALKNRKMKGMKDDMSLEDEAKMEGESPEEEMNEKKMDLAPDVKDSKGISKIEIEVKPGMSDKHAADDISESGDMSDLAALLGKDSTPEEIAQLAGASGKPKSLFEAASRALAQKKMKV